MMGIAMDEMPNSHPMEGPRTTAFERTYAMWTHLLLIAGHVVPVVPSLILWLVKRDESAFIDDHGKEAVNFQISVVIYMIAGSMLVWACGIGVVVILAAYVVAIVGMVMAAMAAHGGRFYRYPMCIRVIR